MNNTRTTSIFYIITSTALFSFVIGFTLSPYPGLAALVAPLGIMWILALRRDKPWIKNSVLLLMILITILAASLGVDQFLLLINSTLTLAAWDLLYLHTTLTRTENILNESVLINTHLIRLTIVCALGFFLALISFFLELEISFGWALFLGLLLIIFLSRTIGLTRQKKQ
jgi:hypothetical protein